MHNTYYKTAHWQALRTKAIKRDGYRCQECGQLCLGRKRNGFSPFVDHINPRQAHISVPTELDVLENLQVLCQADHNKKSKYVDNNEKPPIGDDGFPVDSEWST
jgi:5-methylcytosine-specific restriction protein A